MNIKLLTKHHLELLSLKGGCTGSTESTVVKMLHCWKSRVTAQFIATFNVESVTFSLTSYFNAQTLMINLKVLTSRIKFSVACA